MQGAMTSAFKSSAGMVLGSAALMLVTSVASASITYNGPFGPTANGTVFKTIIEDTNTEAPNTPMYDAPTAFPSSNKIVFSPTASFSAISSDGHSNDADDANSAFALSNGQLTQVLITNPAGIGTVTVGETGHYALMVFGNGTAFVSARGNATLTAQDGPQPGVTVDQTLDLNGNAPGNDLTVTQAGGGTVPNTAWTGSTTFNVGSATSVLLTLDNDLTAYSQAGTYGNISKNRVDISTTGLPEPTVAGLLAAGGLLFARRRRA